MEKFLLHIDSFCLFDDLDEVRKVYELLKPHFSGVYHFETHVNFDVDENFINELKSRTKCSSDGLIKFSDILNRV